MSLDRYFSGAANNPKELRRFDRETAKREQSLRRKKHPPKVVPANLVDLELTAQTIRKTLTDLQESYRAELAAGGKDFDALAAEMLAYLDAKKKEAGTKVTKKEAYDKAIQIMRDVGIKDPERRFDQYPHEFSGGMRQRIVIAIAIAANPQILLCDEPTTALDVTIQAQILELINDIKKKRSLSVLFITHDLGVVANMADRVAVMYAGKIVEYGTVEDIFYDPKHPYTWALLSSMPSLDTKDKLEAIPGTPPNMIYPPVGDAFADRNRYAMKIDFEREPPFFKVSDTHYAATWLLHPDAPKVDPPESVTERIKAMREREALGYDRS
ncbi:MAG: ABC transporter ATP-binding protein [Oscillospiraceae bacterium]